MSKVEVRLDESGAIDEICADAVPVHIERMDDDEISMHIGNRLFFVRSGAQGMETSWLEMTDMGEDCGDGPLPAREG
ncbi:MAG: hypothetical protein WC683_06920 [bacterium]